jgi:hypothetical protein
MLKRPLRRSFSAAFFLDKIKAGQRRCPVNFKYFLHCILAFKESAPSALLLSSPCLSFPLAVDVGAFLLRHQTAQAAVPGQEEELRPEDWALGREEEQQPEAWVPGRGAQQPEAAPEPAG